MSYKNIRNILIILLVFVNIFLGINYFYMILTDKKIFDEKILNQVEILADKGLNIDETMLKNGALQTNSYSVSGLIKENVYQILGSEVTVNDNIYVSNVGSVKFDSDYEITAVLNDTYTQKEVINDMIFLGFDEKLFDKNGTEEQMLYFCEIDGVKVSNLGFQVIINSRNTTIEGNLISQIDKKNTYSVDLFEVLLKICNEHNLAGEVLSSQLLYKLINDGEMLIKPYILLNIGQVIIEYEIDSNEINFL